MVAGCPNKRKEPAWIVTLGTSAVTTDVPVPNGPAYWIPGATRIKGPPMVTPLATPMLTSPRPIVGAGIPFEVAVGAVDVKNPGEIVPLVMARSPPRMNTLLPSTILPPVMLIGPSCCNESTLNPLPSKAASPAEATLTRFTRPPGARKNPLRDCPAGGPTFTAPPTNDSLLSPGGTCTTLNVLRVNVPAWTSMRPGLPVRNPKADGGAEVRALAFAGSA